METIEIIRETIDLNRNELINSKEATNDMLAVDFLRILGYDYRRDKNIKRKYSGDCDWVYYNLDKVEFIMIVKPLDSNDANIEDIIKACESNNTDKAIWFNGEYVRIYVKSISNTKFAFEVSLLNNTDELEDIMTALKREYISTERFEIMYKELNDPSIDDIIEAGLSDNITLESIVSAFGEYREETKESLKQYIISKLRDENNIDNSDISKELEDCKNRLYNADKELAESTLKLNQVTKDLEESNKKLAEAQSINENYSIKIDKSNENELTTYKEKSFIEQIQSLTLELSKKDDKIEELEAEISQLKNIKSFEETDDYIEAKQIMDSIQEDPESTRSYIGIINKKLFQTSDLTEFVSTCIMGLYEIANYDLMPLLFDGDFFKIKESKTQTTLTLNGHYYTINFGNDTEDEILTKIRNLFKQFPNNIFMCKYIGSVMKSSNDIEVDFGNDENNKEIEDCNIKNKDVDCTIDHNNEVNVEASEQSTDIQNNSLIVFEGKNDSIEEPSDTEYKLALSIYDSAAYIPQSDINIEKPLFIGFNDEDSIYNIDMEDIDESFDKIVRILIEHENKNGANIELDDVLDEDDKCHLTDLSNGLSGYALDLYNLCEIYKIDSKSIYIYYKASYSEESIFNQCFVDITDINII